tara:strand:- start:182 stop:697 length:516 start_codon:yes stop_codon:yes gene_type:complete
MFYSPSNRVPSKTSEGDYVECHVVDNIDILYDAIGDYAIHIEDFIMDLEKVFPTLGKDWGIYMPEVKYLSPEPLVNYDDLSLTRFPNVHFVGDALSARGITVSGAQGTYVAESLLILDKEINNFLNDPANNKEPHEMGDIHENLIGGLTMPKEKNNKLNKDYPDFIENIEF